MLSTNIQSLRYPDISTYLRLRGEYEDEPVLAFCPANLNKRVSEVAEHIPVSSHGYAVKANPELIVLETLMEAGLSVWDVASKEEMDLVRSINPAARLVYSNPCRQRSHLRQAFELGVKELTVDSVEELSKIDGIYKSGSAQTDDLTIIVRMLGGSQDAGADLDDKFGVSQEEVKVIMQTCLDRGYNVGLTFHVGSQNTKPQSFKSALTDCWDLANATLSSQSLSKRFKLIDIGGGLPVQYNGEPLPLLQEFGQAIQEGLAPFHSSGIESISEFGRGIVGDSMDLITEVIGLGNGSKAGKIYIADGVHGALSESHFCSFDWQLEFYTPDGQLIVSDRVQRVKVMGRTCDSEDKLVHEILVPSCLKEGDIIVFKNLGAYPRATGRFNGFTPAQLLQFETLDR